MFIKNIYLDFLRLLFKVLVWKFRQLPSFIAILRKSNKCLYARQRCMRLDTLCFSTTRIHECIYSSPHTVLLSTIVIVTQPPRCDRGVALPMDSRGGMATTNKRERTDFCFDFWQISHYHLPLSIFFSFSKSNRHLRWWRTEIPGSLSRYYFTRIQFFLLICLSIKNYTMSCNNFSMNLLYG